jgi:hypothetical protein
LRRVKATRYVDREGGNTSIGEIIVLLIVCAHERVVALRGWRALLLLAEVLVFDFGELDHCGVLSWLAR